MVTEPWRLMRRALLCGAIGLAGCGSSNQLSVTGGSSSTTAVSAQPGSTDAAADEPTATSTTSPSGPDQAAESRLGDPGVVGGARVVVVESQPPTDVANFEDDDRYLTSGVIIDNGDGPELCWGWGDSAPPACKGVPLSGLELSDVAGRTEVDGAWWLEVGITEPMLVEPDGDGLRWLGWAGPIDPADWYGTLWSGGSGERELRCVPEQGWAQLDGTALEPGAFRDALVALEAADPSITDIWIGRITSLGKFPDDPDDQETWLALADSPLNVVLGVRSNDPEATAALAAEIWAGRTCVEGPVGFPEDADDRDDEASMFEFLSSLRPDERLFPNREPSGRWTVGTTFPDPELATALDERYGPGVVEVVPSLLPARGAQVDR